MAADDVTFKVEGLRDLDDTLGQLPRATAKRTLRKVGIDALQPTVADMKSRAPKRFGDLVGGITAGTALTRSQRRYAGFMGSAARNPDMVVVHAGPGGHPQAIIQEIGSFKEPPQPYVTPTWESDKMALLNRTAAGLRDPIMAAAARAAKKGKLRNG